jgi:hypothetical protein
LKKCYEIKLVTHILPRFTLYNKFMEEYNKNDSQEIFSKKIRAGKRTYFFDVKSTRGKDYFLTITESKKSFEDGNYVKHKIFLYKEDFNKFVEALNETVQYIKTDLMPDYDFDEFKHESNEERELKEN